MPSKTELRRKLQQVQYLSPRNRRLLQDALNSCADDQLEMLAAVIERSDQKAKKLEQAYKQKRLLLIDTLLKDFE